MFSPTTTTTVTAAPTAIAPSKSTTTASTPLTNSMLTFGQLQTLASSHYFKHPLSTRHLIFELAAMVGMLSSSFLQHAPLDPSRPALGDLDEAPVPPAVSWTPPEEIRVQMGEMLYQLALCSISCRLDLQECVNTKLALNAKKYPVELCKGQSGKYTEYSDQTGITKTVGQSTSIGEAPKGSAKNGKPSKEDESIVDMQHKITAFSTERLWSRFHTPRNLVLALLGELGELAEIYQWRGDDRAESNVTKKEDLDHVGQELADVTIYLLRLAAVCRFKIGDQTLQVCVKKANM